MILFYYPDLDAGSNANKLCKRILVEFRRISLKKWKPMYQFLNNIESKDSQYFLNLVQSELSKPHKKRSY